MEKVSRRGLLKGAGAGVVAAGALAATRSFEPAINHDAAAEPAEQGANEPVVARVRDLRSGEVELYSGDRSVSVHDRDLARRLARAAKS